jgi:hypothetical protein
LSIVGIDLVEKVEISLAIMLYNCIYKSCLQYFKKVETRKMSDKKDSLIKIKSCAVMQYFEYYDVSEIAVIETRVKNLTNVKSYAIVIHDKDLLES